MLCWAGTGVFTQQVAGTGNRAHARFPHAHGMLPERRRLPDADVVTDDTHSTPLAIPHTTHHIITPLHSIAGLSLPHARDVSLAAFDGGGGGRFAFVAVVAVVERGSRWQRQK